jgi:hypothetical protein
MTKIVDGIKMSEVEADDLSKAVKIFNDAKLGAQIKTGANPLGTAKAFVKAVEALDDAKLKKLPKKVAEYFNRIVVSEEELAVMTVSSADETVAPTSVEAVETCQTPAGPGNLGMTKKTVEKPAPAAVKAAPKKLGKKPPGENSLDSKIICIVEGKEPKKPGTAVYEKFQLYKKCKTVAEFVKAGGKRKEISFDRYHGRIILK